MWTFNTILLQNSITYWWIKMSAENNIPHGKSFNNVIIKSVTL